MRALIADDHAIVRHGLKQILSTVDGISDVDEAKDGQQVLQLCREQSYSIVILDISMPGLSGIEVLNQLHQLYPKLPILILSIFAESQYAKRVLKAGAAGYLSKDSASDELVGAVKKIITGHKYISPSLADKLASQLVDDSDIPDHEKLSDREFEIFLAIANGKAPAQIAEELFLSPKTVGTYRQRLMAKMDLKTTTEIIRYALSHKLI